MGREDAIARAMRDLKISIKTFGYESEQAKQGAIRLCNLYGTNPFIKHTTRLKAGAPHTTNEPVLSQL